MKEKVMIRRMLALCLGLMLAALPAGGALAADYWCFLNQKIATRTGPGNNYDEPGTFFMNDFADTQVKVISRAETNTSWVQIEFTWKGQLMRAYTGAKRIANLDKARVPEEAMLGTGTTRAAATAWYGPGPAYAQQKHTVPAGTPCTVFMEENGYVLVEYAWYDGDYSLCRSWIAADVLQGYTTVWNGPGSGGSSGSSPARGTASGTSPAKGSASGTSPAKGSSSGTSPERGASSGSAPVSLVKQATAWWDEEPEWSYLEVYDVADGTASLFVFFYRIAYVDGTVYLDGEGANHGYFYGRVDYNDDLPVQGEVWFTPNGVALTMNAHQVQPVIEDRTLYWFGYREKE